MKARLTLFFACLVATLALSSGAIAQSLGSTTTTYCAGQDQDIFVYFQGANGTCDPDGSGPIPGMPAGMTVTAADKWSMSSMVGVSVFQVAADFKSVRIRWSNGATNGNYRVYCSWAFIPPSACAGDQVFKDIEVNAQKVPTVSISSPQASNGVISGRCVYSTLSFSSVVGNDAGLTGQMFSWSVLRNGQSKSLGSSSTYSGTGNTNWAPGDQVTLTVSYSPAGTCGASIGYSNVITVNPDPTVPPPGGTIGGPTFVCPGSDGGQFNLLTISGPDQGLSFQWKKDGTENISSTSSQVPIRQLRISSWNYPGWVDISLEITRNPSASCQLNNTGQTNKIRVYNNILDGAISPPSDERCQFSPSTSYSFSAPGNPPIYWTLTSAGGGSNISNNGVVTWDFNYDGFGSGDDYTSYVTANVTGCSQLYKTAEVETLKGAPTPGAVPTIEICNTSPPTLIAPPLHAEVVTLNWHATAAGSTPLFTTPTLTFPRTFQTGSTTYYLEALNYLGCKSRTKTPITIQVTDDCDDQMNTLETKNYDESGVMVANAKSYYDGRGGTLQTQSKTLTQNKVMISQSVKDKFDRTVLMALPAPGPITSFRYKADFIRHPTNDGWPILNYADFDFPSIANVQTLLSTDPGTLGAYYSNSNPDATVPRSQYPYSRIEFYDESGSEVKRSIGVGEIFRSGSDNNSVSCTFPVGEELNYYNDKRTADVGLPMIRPVNTAVKGAFYGEATSTVMRDEQGKYAVSVSDRSGKILMTAAAGYDAPEGQPDDFHLSINQRLKGTATGVTMGLYFCLFQPQSVSISGTSTGRTIKNLLTNVSNANSNGSVNLPAGFYLLTYTNGDVTVTYPTFYKDVALMFYDDAGRLKSTLSPNGFDQLKNQTVPYQKTDHAEYTYDFQGRVKTKKDHDSGLVTYLYNKMGNVRYSQNAAQAGHHKFSYTHYDELDRPVESGEYKWDNQTTELVFGSQQMIDELDKFFTDIAPGTRPGNYGNWWDAGNRTQWLRIYYDKPANVAGFTQQYLSAAISYTENEHISTYYSYNEKGQTTALMRKPKDLAISGAAPIQLNRSFLVEYQYDPAGAVTTTKAYYTDAQGTHDVFYHHYEYDLDKRLTVVKTSTNGSDKIQRAKYYYHLHGPLKRVEVGDRVQGIDFVYNIHGWLTQINHPDSNLDPGGDGTNSFKKDAFGMVIDYYESAMQNLFSVGQNDPRSFHRVPFYEKEESSLAMTNDAMWKDQILENLKQIKKLKAGG